VYATALGGPILAAAPAFLGLGSLSSLVGAALWGDPARRGARLDTCLLACMFPLFLVISSFSLAVTSASHARTYDLFLYAFDAPLGPASFLVGRFVTAHPILQRLCWMTYEGLPLAMAVACAIEPRRAARQAPSIMTAFVVAAAGGFVLYNFYPAVGPIHIFGPWFPYSPPPPGSPPFRLAAAGTAPRNAMPSVHVAMALLILWHSRAAPRIWRWIAAAVLALTVLATLGFGEHYLVDLFVAVPFALLAQALAAPALADANRIRFAAAGTGAPLVIGWLAYLRQPWPPLYGHPTVAWTFLLATVLLALWMERRLDRATALVNQGQHNRGQHNRATASHQIMEACRP
jgi:hypothetical protein